MSKNNNEIELQERPLQKESKKPDLSTTQKIDLMLATYDLFFESEELAPNFSTQMSPGRILPNNMIQLYEQMGYPKLESKEWPTYEIPLETGDFYSFLSNEYKPEPLIRIKDFQKTLISLKNEHELGKFNIFSSCFDSTPKMLRNVFGEPFKVYLYAPFQLILLLETGKQKAYQKVLKSDYKENCSDYLTIVKNIEILKSFYRDLGYLGLGFQTVYIDEKIIDTLDEKLRSQINVKNPLPQSPLNKLRRLILECRIRCPQLELSRHAGYYIAVMQNVYLGKLLDIVNNDSYFSMDSKNESLDSSNFINQIEKAISECKEATKANKFKILEKFVVSLQKVDSLENLNTIMTNLNNSTCRLNQFLGKNRNMMSSFFLESTTSIKLAQSFVKTRIKEINIKSLLWDEFEDKFSAILKTHLLQDFFPESKFGPKLISRKTVLDNLQKTEGALEYFAKNKDAFIFFQMIYSYAAEANITVSELFRSFKVLNLPQNKWSMLFDLLKNSRKAFLNGDKSLSQKIRQSMREGQLEQLLEEISKSSTTSFNP